MEFSLIIAHVQTATYEEWFSSHERTYNMNLPPSYEHVKFEYYPAPKTTAELGKLTLSEPVQAMASMLIANGASKDGHIVIGGDCLIIDSIGTQNLLKAAPEKISVSDTPPKSG